MERTANAAEIQKEEIRQDDTGLGKKKSKRWWICLFTAPTLLYFAWMVGVLKIFKNI